MISRSRLNIALRDMTSASQKVYGAVPVKEFWPVGKIVAEMKRQGVSVDVPHVAGCLNSLLHDGLVREQLRGHFAKSEIREPAPKQETPPTLEIIKEPMKTISLAPVSSIATAQKTPMETLGDLSARAVALAGLVKVFATDIENAAIEIQQQIESGDAETAKLRQLQSILKSLG